MKRNHLLSFLFVFRSPPKFVRRLVVFRPSVSRSVGLSVGLVVVWLFWDHTKVFKPVLLSEPQRDV